jgi:hypothetical protein
MEYKERLREVIRKLHGHESKHLETVPVKEWFQGKVIWDGEVEVFELIGHPDATRCYSWAYQDDDGKTQFVAALGVGPVVSPKAAVQSAIRAMVKNAPKKA